MGLFDFIIWGGAIITLAGVAGLVGCVIYVMRLRRAGLSDEVMRKHLQKGVIYNMIALFVSVIGLMMVVMGIALS